MGVGRGCVETPQAEERAREKGQKLWKRISTREVGQDEVASGRRRATGSLDFILMVQGSSI